MLTTFFDTRYEDTERFRTKVVDSESGGVRVEVDYWFHGQNTAMNPELIIHMTEEHVRQLYEKLDEYLADRKIKEWNDKLNENPAEAAK